jgi:hypothetical protein
VAIIATRITRMIEENVEIEIVIVATIARRFNTAK